VLGCVEQRPSGVQQVGPAPSLGRASAQDGSSNDRHSPGSPAAGGEAIFSFLETSGLHLYRTETQTNNKTCPSRGLTNVNGVQWRIIQYWALGSLQCQNSPQSFLEGYYKQRFELKSRFIFIFVRTGQSGPGQQAPGCRGGSWKRAVQQMARRASPCCRG